MEIFNRLCALLIIIGARGIRLSIHLLIGELCKRANSLALDIARRPSLMLRCPDARQTARGVRIGHRCNDAILHRALTNALPSHDIERVIGLHVGLATHRRVRHAKLPSLLKSADADSGQVEVIGAESAIVELHLAHFEAGAGCSGLLLIALFYDCLLLLLFGELLSSALQQLADNALII